MKRDVNSDAFLIGLNAGQGDEMSKLGLGLSVALFFAALSFSGCCAPMGPIGPGCMDYGCNDCSGCSASTQYIANGPLDALRNARRRMVCGSGCGEAYVGEWISTPPDSHDPCCGDQFVGGATKCRPFCWQPGGLFQGLYGKRFCSGDASSTPCPCGVNFCDGGCSAASTPVMGEVMAAPSGCTTCTANAQPVQQTTRIARRPATDSATATVQQRVRSTKSGQKVVR